jgi:xylan 1,4-beta-xylosidase
MTPVKWEDGGWPVVEGGAISTEMNVPTLPQTAAPASNPTLDFSKMNSFGPEWIHIRNPFKENYIFTGNALQLKAGKNLDERTVSPTFIGRRQEDIYFKSSTCVEVARKASAEAGLSVYMDADAHYDIFLKSDGVLSFRVRLGELSKTQDFKIDKGPVFLQVEGDENLYKFSWSSDGENWHQVGQMNAKYISTESTGGFTGIILGLFSTGIPGSVGTFHSFSYTQVK